MTACLRISGQFLIQWLFSRHLSESVCTSVWLIVGAYSSRSQKTTKTWLTLCRNVHDSFAWADFYLNEDVLGKTKLLQSIIKGPGRTEWESRSKWRLTGRLSRIIWEYLLGCSEEKLTGMRSGHSTLSHDACLKILSTQSKASKFSHFRTNKSAGSHIVAKIAEKKLSFNFVTGCIHLLQFWRKHFFK